MAATFSLLTGALVLALAAYAVPGHAEVINGCDSATLEDHTGDTGTVQIQFGFVNGALKYSPACIKVLSTTPIQFSPVGGTSFGAHPLVAGEVVGSTPTPAMSSPIANQSSGSFQSPHALGQAGFFGYYCNFHAVSSGMKGAILAVDDVIFVDDFEVAN